MRNVKRIIVIRLSSFGDVAMTLPVLETLCTQNPGLEEIILVCKSEYSSLFIHHKKIKVHPVYTEGRHKGLPGLYQLFRELKKYRPQAIGDLHHVLRTRILRILFLYSIPYYSIDKQRAKKRALVSKHKKENMLPKRVFEIYSEVFHLMGLRCHLHYGLHNFLFPTSPDKTGIGFSPYAKHRLKSLKKEKIAQCISDLLIHCTEPIYIFGGKNEEILWKKLQINNPRIHPLFHLNLEEQLIKLSSLKAMVSMDSANMHLASLTGTPVVSIWQATHPDAGFLGFGQEPKDAVQCDDLACRPCSIYGNKTCWRGDEACRNIDTASVIQKIGKYL